ncbi:type II toxin-antitoxin system HicB family antitoxin [Candidatus Microgenomates bacterium]|nr:type II toxin-antitoxin system HicB family antitoxin [Candidatus Microgenomates bacterium]
MKVKRLNYLIELTYDKSYKGYVTDVVNLYGCMSQGKTKEEALKNTDKAIKAYMEALKKASSETEIVHRSVATPIPMAYA